MGGGPRALHAPEFSLSLLTVLRDAFPAALNSQKVCAFFVVEGLHAPELRGKVKEWEGERMEFGSALTCC